MVSRFFSFYLFLSITGLFVSCSSEKGAQPDEYINKAKELLKVEQFQKAKIYLDSIQLKFPKNFAKIREGISVMREINFAEQKRTLSFCDSMLKIRQDELPEAQKSFSFIKDTEYETVGNYVHKSQIHENNYSRTYLQTKVDEKGNLILTSFYCGSRAINHDGIRVTTKDGSYVESLKVHRDGALNYAFQDNGTHYESVHFNRKAENGIINFILMHANDPVTVALQGGALKSYRLTQNEKAVMKSASELSVILSDITQLLNEIHLAQAKLDYLYSKQQQSQQQKADASSN
jgi:hypothetical protein